MFVPGQTQKSGRAIGKSALPLKSGLHQVSLSGPFRADFVAKVGCNRWMSFGHSLGPTGFEPPALTLSTQL